jgi:Protein of unknown function (DUF3089)
LAARASIRLALLCLCAAATACVEVAAEPPPAPDYAQPASWAAWPGRASGVESVPTDLTDATLPEAQQADVFFIHPTTDLSLEATNARYDEPGAPSTRIARGVLRYQASAFNACCRIYAPHYRQATIGVFLHADDTRAAAAFELAYGDVLRAFDYYLAHENRGRPFLIASHSQGSLHALRLLQERIVRTPLAHQLVAAYVIGYYIPLGIEQRGLNICRSARQSGCLVDWNTVKPDHDDSQRENRRLVWLDGRYQHVRGQNFVCVNPLNWILNGTAAASLNLGALPAAAGGGDLPALVPHLTGATCDGARLEVDIPLAERRGFSNVLTLAGSYHVFDYNLFYLNIRENAKERILSYRAAAPAR